MLRVACCVKKVRKFVVQIILDFGLASFPGGGVEVAEKFSDVMRFEVDAFDFVIGATALDGRPVDNGCAARDGVAHVRLLEDLLEASASLTVRKELSWGEVSVAGAIDDVEEALFDGVSDGDLEVEVPRGRR